MFRLLRVLVAVLGSGCVGNGVPRSEPSHDSDVLHHDTADTAPEDDPGWWGWTPCLPAERVSGGDLDHVCAEYNAGRSVPRESGEVALLYDDLECTEVKGSLPLDGEPRTTRIPAPPGAAAIRVWCAYPGHAWAE